MTSPQPTDQKPRIDPVEALRVLVADLRALADRLALKEHDRSLQQTLKAAQERVSGPRAVVMLLGEHEDLKRRFLERLLGPNLAQVPKPTTVCTRLEYGVQPECSVTMPQGLTAVLPLDQLEAFLVQHADRQADRDNTEKTVRTIRLPNPALKSDLAVIDTPIVECMEPAASLLECAAQADVWIFVLQADHELSEASYVLLSRLPERGARLEMVVEGAEALNAEERLAARERLMRTLSERCNIEAPRLTLIASAPTEGDAESFWHGRFATFHSVMMLRGRERSLEATRAAVAVALAAMGTEIDSELKSIGLGLRHARLRLGMKDLDGLQTRFDELRQLDSPPLLDANATHEKAAMQPAAGNLPLMPVEAMAAVTPGSLIDQAQNGDGLVSATPEKTDTSAVAPPFAAPAVVPEPTFVSFRTPTADARPSNGLAVKFNEKLRRLVPRGGAAEGGKITLPQRVASVALAASFVCLILWALAPRGFLFGHEAPSEWEYHPPENATSTNPVAPAAATAPDVSLPQPGAAGSLPDPTGPQTPSIPEAPLRKRSAAIRTPLLRPIPSGATAGVPRYTKRHHRHLLGLGKLWHWVRHPHRQNHPADR